jgi:hypothetical protein
MDFFLGFLVTMITIFIMARRFSKQSNLVKPIRIKFSQSSKFEMIRYSYEPFLLTFSQEKDTQATLFKRKHTIKILMLDEKAYWIASNGLTMADLNNGEVVLESAKIVDTISMNDVELKKIMFVIDQLTEGNKDDLGNPGNKEF